MENINIFLDEKYNYKNIFLPKYKNYNLDQDKVFIIKIFLSMSIFIISFGIIILFYAKKNIEMKYSIF